MRQYIAPVRVSGRQPNDPMFEPEDEALCGVLPHNRLPVAEPPPGVAQAAVQGDEAWQQKRQEAILSASRGGYPAGVQMVQSRAPVTEDAEEICKSGPLFYRMARDLIAKKAVDKYLKRKAKAAKKPRGVNFEHLPCCVENEQLQDSISHAEQSIGRQSLELKNVTRARNEEVAQLSAEVSHLQEQLRQQDDLLEDGGPDTAQELRVQLDMAAARARIEAEDIRQQLMCQRNEIEVVRQQTLQAQREAAEHRAKLAVYRETHDQEMAEMRRRLQPAGSSGPATEADLESSRCKVADLEISLRAATRSREEAEQLLQTDRKLQQQEIDLLTDELRTTRTDTQDAQQLQRDFTDTRQRETDLEEKVIHVACEKLQADKALRELEEGDRNLLRQCLGLYEPANALMSMFGQPMLPACGQAEDPLGHIEWLQALSASMADLHEQLQARMQDG